MDVVWSDIHAERVSRELRETFLDNYDNALSDCFSDLYRLYIAVSTAVYMCFGVYVLSRGQPKHSVAVLLTGIVFGVKLATGHYAFTQVASGARHRLIGELAHQLSLFDGDLSFVVDTIRRFVLPTDALFAFAQSAIPLICLLLSTLFENKRPLHFIAAIATIDLCWIVATPNTYNFVGKLHAIDMIEHFAKLRAFLFLYA